MLRIDVRLINASIGEHKAKLVLNDKDAGSVPNHLAGLFEDDLNEPRVLLHLLSIAPTPVRPVQSWLVDISSLCFRDDFLSYYHHVIIEQCGPVLPRNVANQAQQVGSRLNERNAGKCYELQIARFGGAAHARPG